VTILKRAEGERLCLDCGAHARPKRGALAAELEHEEGCPQTEEHQPGATPITAKCGHMKFWDGAHCSVMSCENYLHTGVQFTHTGRIDKP
jgi:hypothetical protein